jgi:4'-phosphopantetheinyl transferase
VSAELVVVLGRLTREERAAPGPQRVARASARARETVLESARRVGARLAALEQNERDAPLPSAGWHWSVAHAGDRVVGVVARHPVGVDLEPLTARSSTLVAAVLSAAERALLGPDDPLGFLRGWTAKEAVLKKLGVGLTELSRCRIVAAPAADVLELEHDGRLHRVDQTQLDDAVVSVTVDGPQRRVRWVEEQAA